MISKEKLKEHIDKFPENEISIDELIDRLVFIEKLEKRIYQSENSKDNISEIQLKDDMKKWSR